MIHLLLAGTGFGLVSASILAIAAVGFTLQLGIADIFNFSYGAIFTSSALAAYGVNAAGVNIWVCAPVGMAFGAVASALLNRIVVGPFSRRGTRLFGMVIVTLGLAILIENLILAVWGPRYFTYHIPIGRTFHLGGLILTVSQIVVIGVSAAVMVLLHLLLHRTRLGRAMRATADDDTLARTSGIRTARVKDVVWLVSGALCGLAGVTFVVNTVSFNASTGTDYLILVVAAAMLGGAGQPYGAMVGAVVVGLASEIAATVINPAYKDVVALVILVGVLLVRPHGLFASADVVDIERGQQATL